MANKVNEIRKLSELELTEKLKSNLSEFKKAKFQLKSGAINAENIKKARTLKVENARIKTVLNELKIVK